MEANWTAFLFQAHEASHHQQQAAQNSLLPLLSSAVEPPDQKPILPLPITQKPQPAPETLKDAIVGIKKEKPKTSFVCTYCSKAFRDSYHLRRHESCHTGIKLVSRPKKTPTTMVPLISTIAGDNSRTSLVSTIAGILSTVTTSSSATNPSSSAGATAMAVTQTVKKPSKPVKKNHACEMCGKAFRDVYHLNRHKLSHSDEKPFECPICNQRFKRKDRMTYHVRSHEGGITKPYTCGVCGKGFSRYHVENPRRAQVLAFRNQEGLNYHSKGLGEPDILEDWPDHLSCHVKHVHSTERPFKCQTCTAAFATKDRLRTHMVRHEGKVSCNICGKLLSAAYITSHLKTHGQSQSINCNTCKQGISKTCMSEETSNQKQQQQQQQQQHVTNWPGKQVETLRLWEEAVKARKKEAANLCQTSTAATTPVTLTTPFNITSSVASGTITNPVTVAAAMSMRSPVNVSSAVNISSPMNLGHPVTITSPLSMTSPLTLTTPVNLPTPVTAPVNIAHPVTITSPMNLQTPMTLAGPLNIAMRPVESMPFLPQALPTSPPW
ncbi:vascular endothelial zinc finger 1 isoform X2 [Mauremys mutica]|uniref:vascular endothelial zinc finger 1 isoform X2 n=1 Tax=Terrapene triunguis TaxID=2587831 RepID=UPI000CEFFDFB|nr:vascular endothelial zinc finger 1 isoform X2 [Terrapene carolina triunguis]XP_044849643.1 vascular endothelial zinc finger 1 isoform X2 [Mauremys mutica]XP_050785548.1 vascular endothelial zinc finger 1 isoform X2 [Gopherus flavomarginatus]